MKLFRALLVVGCLVGTASASYAGPIVNGSFEQLCSGCSLNRSSGAGANTWGLFSAIPGWSASGSNLIEIGTAATYGVTGQAGNNVLELDSTANAVISQIVASPGGVYSLNFLVARRNGTVAPSAELKVFWNNVEVAYVKPTDTLMTRYAVNVIGHANNTNTLRFEGFGTSDSYGALVDDVQLNGVPDGGTSLFLLGSALTAIGVFRRRQS